MNFVSFREPVNAWSHCAWMLLSVPGTFVLWWRGGGNRAKQLSLLVFGLSLAFCYACSTLYHGVRLPEAEIQRLDRLDHIAIYVLIAGSYTPVAWVVLRGLWRWGILVLAWLLAAAGTELQLRYGSLAPSLSTGLYLAMGWGALFCYFEVARHLSHRALIPLVAGGLFYSIGAVFNLLNWPVFWPTVFGSHELFHLFVMAGSLAHFWFMFKVVAPFDPAQAPSNA